MYIFQKCFYNFTFFVLKCMIFRVKNVNKRVSTPNTVLLVQLTY